jgi:hypothetical protein
MPNKRAKRCAAIKLAYFATFHLTEYALWLLMGRIKTI